MVSLLASYSSLTLLLFSKPFHSSFVLFPPSYRIVFFSISPFHLLHHQSHPSQISLIPSLLFFPIPQPSHYFSTFSSTPNPLMFPLTFPIIHSLISSSKSTHIHRLFPYNLPHSTTRLSFSYGGLISVMRRRSTRKWFFSISSTRMYTRITVDSFLSFHSSCLLPSHCYRLFGCTSRFCFF